MLKKTLLSLAIATTTLSLAACNNADPVAEPVVEPEVVTEPVVVEPEVAPETEVLPETDPTAAAMPTQSIAELATGNPELSTLVEALQAAGLDTMMTDAGTYTVFAPTNDAFAKALTSLNMTKEELFANTDLLKSVLTYHVVPSVVKAADIPYGTDIATANEQTISISDANVITDASGNTANITGTDIMANNGVVHTVDTVLLPKS